jgi:hypothetical protein
MTVDFVRLAPQLHELIEFLDRDSGDRRARLARARGLLSRVAATQLDEAISGARNANWLLARAIEPLSTRRGVPAINDGYAAIATDGSSIDVNRHSAASCYLINIGRVLFDYSRSEVDLANQAELEFVTERLRRGDATNASRETVITGNLLDAYRTAKEMLELAALAESRPGETPIVAMLDGQFVLWGLKESELSSDARELIFANGVLSALDRLRAVAARGTLVAGSFISRPSGREVTNSLRLLQCPRPGGVDCRDCPRLKDFSRPCDEIAGGSDADLFERFLQPGERSAIFARDGQSSDRDGPDTRYESAGHGLRFFYLQIPQGEVARVELPEWVADSERAVDLLQAAILDQCARGGGYPLALQEAHEQAVIDGAARRSFSLLLDRQLESGGAWRAPSSKSWSKRYRPI